MTGKKLNITEEELVASLRRKEKRALELLYDNYSASIYGVINKVTPAPELSEEILQDTFLKIWNSIDSYDEKKGRLFTWMMNIARNMAIDKLRSKDYKNSLKNHDISDSVYILESDDRSDKNEDRHTVKLMLSKLSSEHRQVIEATYFHGLTQTETAKELNIPLGTVKTRMRLAVNKLREILKIKKK